MSHPVPGETRIRYEQGVSRDLYKVWLEPAHTYVPRTRGEGYCEGVATLRAGRALEPHCIGDTRCCCWPVLAEEGDVMSKPFGHHDVPPPVELNEDERRHDILTYLVEGTTRTTHQVSKKFEVPLYVALADLYALEDEGTVLHMELSHTWSPA